MAGLKSEEPCFPRGSTKSSNVTPSRHVPMERDTLFQDPGSKKRRRSDHTAKATKKKRSVTLKEAKSVSVTRAEVMVFSKLSVGMKILGAVQLVNEVDMVVSLPGGLTGVVSLREISDIMADRVDKFVDSDDNDANEALPDLRDLYQVGQLVPCVVSRLDRVDSAKHIDLTTRSSLFNGFTSEAQIQTGMIVSCTVVSAEPRGYVVDFGITRGFLPFKEIEDDGQKFVPGQPIMVRVVSKGSAAVSVSLREIASSKAKSSWNLSLPMLTPGTLVKATIKEKLPDGYLFTFFDAFSGTADYFNLDGRELEIGSKHSARILYIDQERKVASLSLREDIVKWQSGMQPLPVGHITTATIVAFDALRGLILSTKDNHRAYAHISQCSDKRLAKLEKEFQIGQTLRCRAMAYKPIDGALSVSLRESILSQAILSLDDVKAGDSISVTIDQVQPCGVFVNVTNHISALCPLHHVTELRNAHNKVILKLRPGKKVDARILRVDHETRRVAVTFKKTLVASTDALISSWEDVHAGVIAHGSVVTIRPDIGLFVEFYNNICGLVPLSDLKASGFTDLEKSFFRGQVVRVQVVHSNAQRQRMGLSLRISGSSSSNLIVTSETGSVAEGLLAGYDEQSIHVEFGSCKEPCTIPIHHLSDHSSNANSVFERLKKESVGSKFTIGILGRINDSMLLGTLKPLLVSAMQSGVFPKSISDLNVGDICQGYIKAVESFGAFIAFNNDLCGLCPGRMMDSPSFEVGQSVLGQVVEVDSEKKRFIVSLKPSDIKPDEPRLNALTMSYFNELDATLVDDHIDWSTLAFGNVVDAKVDVRKDFGVVFSLEPKPVKGFAIAPHNTEGASLEFGNLVKAIVLDVDRQLKIVDLNVSDEAVKQRHRYQKSANKATKKKSKRAIADLPKPGQTISSKVCLVKDNHVVVSLPDYQGRIAFALAYDYNHRITRSTLTPGTAVNVIFIGEHGSNRLLVRFDFPSLLLEGSKLWNSRIPNVGEQVQGKVVDIRNLYACVRLPNVRSKTQLVVCRIWIGHVTDDVNAKPFGEGGCINVGSEITANVISSMQRGDVLILGLSMLKETPTINTVDDVTRGWTLPAYVKAIKDNIWVALSPLVKACVHPLLVSSPGNQSFEIGQRVEATILRIDSSQSQLDASLNGVSDFKKLITPGARLTGRIRSIMKPRYLVVEIAPQIFGRVPLSEISDEFTDEPLSSFQSGQYVSVRVISINDDLSRINLSLRNNAAPISSISDCQIGQLVSGYVTDCGSKGCFVELSGTVTAQVRIADLSDRFIPDVASVFTAGKLVKGRISTVSPPNHIGLSLKESIVDPDSAGAIATVAPGSIVTGCIINIRDFGIFVRIDNDTGARVTGMAHVSEIFDEKDETISLKDRIAKYYAVGDAVRARVILVDPKSNRINLSLKHSQVDTDMNEASTEFEEKDAELAGMDIDCDVQELNIPEVEMAAALSDDDSDNECSSNAEPELSANAHQTSEDVKEKASTQSRKTMIERVRAEEAKLEHIEKRIADGERVPENVEDFERLAIASPNSSLMWCRYIAFQLSLNETQLAREVAERALTTIHYREEAELLNIWVALINLENLYGSSETRSAALERSLKACDPKKLLNRVAQMFELSDNQIECDSTHKDICKRYPESRNAWINAVGYKFRSGRPDIARPMLKQALQMLPKRKHIRFITSFALFEFKMGSVERGRTILEGVLGNYPKRVDLWSIYLDQEIRIGDQAVCRRLFDRVIHLDLSVKKMKFFFKRYLQYEREYGDEASIEHVKEAAKAFVASRVSS